MRRIDIRNDLWDAVMNFIYIELLLNMICYFMTGHIYEYIYPQLVPPYFDMLTLEGIYPAFDNLCQKTICISTLYMEGGISFYAPNIPNLSRLGDFNFLYIINFSSYQESFIIPLLNNNTEAFLSFIRDLIQGSREAQVNFEASAQISSSLGMDDHRAELFMMEQLDK